METEDAHTLTAAERAERASSRRYSVPAINGNATRRFAPMLGLTFLAWLVVWPLFTFGFINRYGNLDAAWIEALYQRKDLSAQRPAAGTGGRIIIVGGSGALYGIDAELIERKLGVTTVNYATHAGLGGYILDRAKRVIQPGDTVLLCPEYELWYTRAADFSDVEWAYVCSYDSKYVWSLGWKPALGALYSQPAEAYWQALLGWRARYQGIGILNGSPGPQNVEKLDSCGDLRVTPPRRSFESGGLRFASPADPECAIGEWRHFSLWAKDQHVRVLYSWPNIYEPSFPNGAPPGAVKTPDASRALLDEFGFVSLNEPSDTLFPRTWFTDTPYHLDAGGRRVRTEALIQRLRPYFGKPTAPPQSAGIYLVGGDTQWLRPGNTFADSPEIKVKYLNPAPADCPGAITPAGAAAAAAQGQSIWLDDPTVRRMLPESQWQFQQADQLRESLGQWFTRYNHHLLLISHVGSDDNSPTSSSTASYTNFPAELRAPLSGREPAVAMFGTGPWSGIRRIRTDARTALIEERLTDLAGAKAPELALLVRADNSAVAKKIGVRSPCRIQANSKAILLGPAGAITVAVIDPLAGILVDSGTFEADQEKTVWCLWKATPRR